MSTAKGQALVMPTSSQLVGAAYVPPAGVETPCFNPDDDADGRRAWADEWFPTSRKDGAFAKNQCRRCPVRLDCGEWAMRHERGMPAAMRFGVWGGLTPEERAALDRGEAA